MSDEDALWAACRADPTDDTARRVFADRLEEAGFAAFAAVVRSDRARPHFAHGLAGVDGDDTRSARERAADAVCRCGNEIFRTPAAVAKHLEYDPSGNHIPGTCDSCADGGFYPRPAVTAPRPRPRVGRRPSSGRAAGGRRGSGTRRRSRVRPARSGAPRHRARR